MNKVALAVNMIEMRIAHADHVVNGIPSERQLAEELGLSRTTVRTAVQSLIEKQVLVRRDNGRIDVASAPDGSRRRTLGFIAPAGASDDVAQWRESVEGALHDVLHDQSITVRSVSYGHWADPVIQEVLSGFEAAFLVTPAEKIPAWLVKIIKSSRCRVVVLDQDESDAGLPSVTLFPPAVENNLLDYLFSLGHRRIDCINTQERGAVIQGRIAVWKQYLQTRGIAGQLHSQEQRNPFESAYRMVSDLVRAGQLSAPALFCTTGPAAMGAMRALYETGLKVGREVSVCAVNSEGIGRYTIPSLTALEAPPRSRYLQRVSEWMFSDAPWEGPLLIQPEGGLLFEGESTGPPQATKLGAASYFLDHSPGIRVLQMPEVN
jgi:DNA-binding LacI/PurR family transcriptional regulator